MSHPVLTAGRVAVVTGAVMGIGLAACRRFAALGMRVGMADVLADELQAARLEVARLAPGGDRDVFAMATDVARPEDVESLRDAVSMRPRHRTCWGHGAAPRFRTTGGGATRCPCDGCVRESEPGH